MGTIDAAASLTPTETLTLTVLAQYADEHGIAFPGLRTLSRAVGRGVRTIQRAIARLADAGFLAVQFAPSDVGTNVYRLVVDRLPTVARRAWRRWRKSSPGRVIPTIIEAKSGAKPAGSPRPVEAAPGAGTPAVPKPGPKSSKLPRPGVAGKPGPAKGELPRPGDRPDGRPSEPPARDTGVASTGRTTGEDRTAQVTERTSSPVSPPTPPDGGDRVRKATRKILDSIRGKLDAGAPSTHEPERARPGAPDRAPRTLFAGRKLPAQPIEQPDRVLARLPGIPDRLNTPGFVDAWRRWIQFNAETRRRMTPTRASLHLDALVELGPVLAITSLRIAIENGWHKPYPPRERDVSDADRRASGLDVGTDGRWYDPCTHNPDGSERGYVPKRRET